MRERPSKPFRIGSIVSSILLSISVVMFGVSVLLPSTKRARIHFNQVGADPESSVADNAATQPSTQP